MSLITELVIWPQVAQARNWHCCVTFVYEVLFGRKTIVSRKDLNTNRLTTLKLCVSSFPCGFLCGLRGSYIGKQKNCEVNRLFKSFHIHRVETIVFSPLQFLICRTTLRNSVMVMSPIRDEVANRLWQGLSVGLNYWWLRGYKNYLGKITSGSVE